MRTQRTAHEANSEAIAPIYAVVDKRRDGRMRVVSEFADPAAARTAADLLRAAGGSFETC